MEQWLVIVNDASAYYTSSNEILGCKQHWKAKEHLQLYIEHYKSLPCCSQVWLSCASTCTTAVTCEMLRGHHQNKMLQEMNDLQSFGRRGGQDLGWKRSLALLSPAQTSAAYRTDLKKQDPFYLHSLWIVSPAQGLEHPGPPAVGAALGMHLQLHQANVGQAAIQIFWIQSGSWIMQYTQAHTQNSFCCFCQNRWQKQQEVGT